MKRAFGVLSMLLMFHLVLVGSDLACATHGTRSTGAHSSMAHGAHHTGNPTGRHSEQERDCDTPVSPDCCSAQTPCAPTIDVAVVVSFAEPIAAAGIIPDGVDSSPLLRLTAPETPPPRT